MSQLDRQHSQLSVSSSAVSSIRQATCDQEGNITIKKRTLAKRHAETFEVSQNSWGENQGEQTGCCWFIRCSRN